MIEEHQIRTGLVRYSMSFLRMNLNAEEYQCIRDSSECLKECSNEKIDEFLATSDETLSNVYIINHKTTDGDFEYYDTMIIRLPEGKYDEVNEESFLTEIYGELDTEDSALVYDDFINRYLLDYRIIEVWNWKEVETKEELHTLMKYNI